MRGRPFIGEPAGHFKGGSGLAAGYEHTHAAAAAAAAAAAVSAVADSAMTSWIVMTPHPRCQV